MKEGVTVSSPLLAEFGYDELYRLISVQSNNNYYPFSTLGFTYDSLGNRKTRTTNSTITENFNYFSGTNRLECVAGSNSCAGQNIVDMQYDMFGNLEFKSDGVSTHAYSYDFNNMLVSADTDGDQEPDEAYLYNFGNKRVKKTAPETVTYYVYDISGNAVYEEEYEQEMLCDSAGFNFESGNFVIRDGDSAPVAMIDEAGMMLLKGAVKSGDDYEAPDGHDFVIANGDGNVNAWIDDMTGNLYLKGSLNTNALPAATDNHELLVVRAENGEVVARFDADTGSLTLKSCMSENYAFG